MISENYSEDLNLALHYQATGDEKAYERLLEKYTPIITKKAISLVHTLYGRDRSITIEDVFSDLKICLLQAINRIKLEKVGGDKKKFTLYGTLIRAIGSYRYMVNGKKKVEICDIMFNNTKSKIDEYTFEDLIGQYEYGKYTLDDYYYMFRHEELLQDFMKKKLNAKQSKIFKLFLQGKSVLDISKQLKCTTKNIHDNYMSKVKRALRLYLKEVSGK